MKQLHVELIESFGYTAEDTATSDAVGTANDATALAASKKPNTGKIAGRLGGVLTVLGFLDAASAD